MSRRLSDFPFEYGKFLGQSGRNALCRVSNIHYGKQVLVVGAGVSEWCAPMS